MASNEIKSMADEKEVDEEDENVAPPSEQEGENDAPAEAEENSAPVDDTVPVDAMGDAVAAQDDEPEAGDGEAGEAGDQGEDDPEAGSEDESEEDSENAEEGEEDEESEGEDGEAEEGEALPMTAVVEAILFAAREPLKPAQIARAVGKGTRQDAVRAAVEELNVHYLETGRAFEIAEISERYQLMSRPEYARHIMRIYPKRELHADKDKSNRLTPAAMDTLAIIAYKQPVMRSEIERIRGVACGPVLKMLIERGSVKQVGRRTDLVGKPSVFGTTEKFLAEFGLGSLDELPLRNDYLPAPGEEPPVELLPEEGGTAAAAPQPDDTVDISVETVDVTESADAVTDTQELPPESLPEAVAEIGVEGDAAGEAEAAESGEGAEGEHDEAEPADRLNLPF